MARLGRGYPARPWISKAPPATAGGGGVTAPSGPTTLATVTHATTALTTSSFTPAANSLVIVTTWGDSSGSAQSCTISDSLTGAWVEIDLLNFADSPAANSFLQAWWQLAGTSPASRTVTVSATAASKQHACVVEQWTGVDQTTPIGAEGATNTAGAGNPISAALTTQQDNSIVAGSAVNWDQATWSGSGGSQIDNQISMAATNSGCTTHLTAPVTPAGSATLTVSRVTTADQSHILAFEIRGVAGAPSAPASPPQLTSQYTGWF